MPAPGTAAAFIAALKSQGVTVKEHSGWRTHNRNGKGSWGPLYGVMFHHTVSTDAGITEYCYNGSAELPGPLCHGVIHKDGSVTLVGWGRANHAGGGDPDVLASVKAERVPLPETNQHQGSAGAVDGNAHFIGFECVNKGDGSDPWPAVQLAAMKRAAAAVCDLYGWSAKSVIRHTDWSDWKSDPKGIDWPKFTADVQKLIDADKHAAPVPSKPAAPAVPKPPPAKPKVSLAHVVAAARRDPAAPQGSALHRAESLLVERALVSLGYLDKRWADGSFGTMTRAAYAKLQGHLGYSGTGADGIPGSHSLQWLALKTQSFIKTS